jgi:hypothetical protein
LYPNRPPLERRAWRIWVLKPMGQLVEKVYEIPTKFPQESDLEVARRELGGSVFKFAEVGSGRDVHPGQSKKAGPKAPFVEPPRPLGSTDLLPDPFGDA